MKYLKRISLISLILLIGGVNKLNSTIITWESPEKIRKFAGVDTSQLEVASIKKIASECCPADWSPNGRYLLLSNEKIYDTQKDEIIKVPPKYDKYELDAASWLDNQRIICTLKIYDEKKERYVYENRTAIYDIKTKEITLSDMPSTNVSPDSKKCIWYTDGDAKHEAGIWLYDATTQKEELLVKKLHSEKRKGIEIITSPWEIRPIIWLSNIEFCYINSTAELVKSWVTIHDQNGKEKRIKREYRINESNELCIYNVEKKEERKILRKGNIYLYFMYISFNSKKIMFGYDIDKYVDIEGETYELIDIYLKDEVCKKGKGFIVSVVSISPDRSKMILINYDYSHPEIPTNRNLFLADIDGSDVKQLTFTKDIEENDWALWSPQGDKIAYSAWNKKTDESETYILTFKKVKNPPKKLMTKHKIEATAFRHFKKAQRLQYKLHLTPEEEIEMLREYEIIIKKYPNTQWAAEAFYGLGLYYEGRDFDKALYYYQKCVQKFENRSATSIIIAHAYRNIGDLFFGWLNNYQKAIKNYKKAIRCMKIYLENPLNDERDYMQLGSLQRSLGLTYERLKDYKNALKEFENAKISFEKANYPAALIEAKNIVSDIERVKRKLMFGNK